MGNCCPFKLNKKSHKKDFFSYIDENTKIKNVYSPDNFILYGTIKKTDYFSPKCTKRPYYAQKTCKNCNMIFYSYRDKEFCSNDCSFSNSFKLTYDNGYNSN